MTPDAMNESSAFSDSTEGSFDGGAPATDDAAPRPQPGWSRQACTNAAARLRTSVTDIPAL